MKNKVYTMTFHWATNYGAVVQAYALQKCLEQMGCDVEIINYVPRKHKKTLLRCFRTRKLWTVRKQVQEYIKERKIEIFRQRYLRRTKCFSNNGQLMNEKWGQATYICGSDQIWNPYFTMQGEGIPTSAYYLEFAPEDSNKFAYAASFGTDEISESMQKFIKDLLLRFRKISVRENTAKRIVKDLKLEAIVVCDPVFLLERNQYEIFADDSPNSKGKLFSYILHEKQETARVIGTYVAENLRLEAVDERSWTIEQWLGNIKNAEFVITNSFHATAFALIFHIPFITVLVSESGMNDRIQTLLENMSLKNRMIENFNEEQINEAIKSDIDWKYVDYKILQMRESSMDFLSDICEL